MPEQKRLSVEEAYSRSVAYYQRADFKPAVALLNRIVASAPAYAPAHQLLGLIGFRLGQLRPAEQAMREALRLQPDNPSFLSNFVEVLRKIGHAEEAVATGQRAVALAPQDAGAQSNLGLAHYDNGDLEAASLAQHAALALNPSLPAALNNLGSIARDKGDREAAAELYRKVITQHPDHLESVTNLISVLIELEALDEATDLCESYLRRAPKHADLHRCRGRLYTLAADLDAAEDHFRKSIALDPGAPEAYVGLARILFEKNHADLALEAVQSALKCDPQHASAHHVLGLCKSHLGDIDAAFAAHRKALDLEPDLAAAQISLGHLFMEKGEFDRARDLFETVTDHARASLNGHIALVRLDKVDAASVSFAHLVNLNTTSKTIVPEQAVARHYALGKGYEDLKDYDAAFEHFAEGARIKRGLIDYDPDRTSQTTDDLIATFTFEFLDRMRESAIDSPQPIFVLGMPRSGTTLTESILAAHQDVFGAGELNFLHSLFSDRTRGGTADTGQLIAGLEPTTWSERVLSFVDQLNARAPGMSRIVDKMPANFQFIGLIHALMPNAKIVHVARDPMDTCLSCFTRVFERSQFHSYDQIELARYYNDYARLMRHWSDVLPAGSLYTIRYEALVDHLERESRALLAYCGLDWDPACLAFHKEKRRVRTASVQQVRQPIYASSKGKWRRYERHLAPLAKTLGLA